jgi:D-alanyl-D-alanine endopeptidase (penicillin-binding protein 7)
VAALARAAGLRRPPRVVVGPAAAGAFVAGRSAPVLVLPAGLARPGLTGSASRAPDRLAWDALVLHELAHVRRGDYVAQWGVRAAEALCWWHPGARRLARAAADAREECCDEEAVRAAARATARPPRQARVALARALVWLADAASGAAPPGARRGAPAPLGMAATSGALSARVRLLLRADAPPARGGGRPHLARRLLAALLAGAGGAVVAAGPTLAAPAAARGQRLPLAAARSGTVPVRRVAIDAGDPAGRFTVRLLNGRVAEVTVDGRRVGPRQVTVRGTGLRVRGAGDVVLLDARLDPRGALSWTARPARAR